MPRSPLQKSSPRARSVEALREYLRLVWRAVTTLPDHPDVRRLRASLERGSYVLIARVFDSTGSIHARVRISHGDIVVEPLSRIPTQPQWIVSQRYLEAVLGRPDLYLQNPARLDLGWVVDEVA